MSGLDAVYARAGGFLALSGGALDRIHLETLLAERDGHGLLAAFAERQAPDGRIAEWQAGAERSPVETTLGALAVLDGVGLLDHPVPEAALGFLLSLQSPDGGFGDESHEEESRILLTGAVVGLAAKSPFGPTRVLRRAEAYLLERWSVERVQGPCYAPILAYTHALASFTSDAADTGDEALQWCGRELERGFRMGAFGPLEVVRVFCRARARALPGARLDPPELVTALVTAQEDDGGWTGDAGVSRVTATLEAVEALRRLA